MLSGVIELMQEISAPVKVGWMLWILWCVAQIAWYRRGRSILAQQQAPRIDARKRPSVEPRLKAPAEAPAHDHTEVSAAVPAHVEPPPVSIATKPSRRRRRPSVDASDAVAPI